mgnify:CR=1 FL=1
MRKLDLGYIADCFYFVHCRVKEIFGFGNNWKEQVRKMVNIIMVGCNGKMGQVISRIVSEDDNYEIVAGSKVSTKIGVLKALKALERSPQLRGRSYLLQTTRQT